MKDKDVYVILIRPLTADRWKSLAYAKSLKLAQIEALADRDGLSFGDLLLILKIEEVSAINERGKRLYYVDGDIKVQKAPSMPIGFSDSTWLEVWEGPAARANTMLMCCRWVSRKLVFGATIAIIRQALRYCPTETSRHSAVLDRLEEAINGGQDFDFDMNLLFRFDRDGVSAAVKFAGLAWSARSEIDRVPEYIAMAMPGNYNDNIRELSHIVREYIPLHVVLESRV